MLTDLEKRLIGKIQGDMPIVPEPYEQMGQELGVSGRTVVEILQKLSRSGVMRRFGATLRHQASGYSANAMVAWKVCDERLEEVGALFSDSPGVSHCYHRPPKGAWPYNLYTMVHARSVEEVHSMAKAMSEASGIGEYSVLFSRKELKKTSMEYFPTDEDD
ncbi:MAG: Lrp/AsnC family transcriptional regulator [Thermodesulfobacteriota bacterium]